MSRVGQFWSMGCPREHCNSAERKKRKSAMHEPPHHPHLLSSSVSACSTLAWKPHNHPNKLVTSRQDNARLAAKCLTFSSNFFSGGDYSTPTFPKHQTIARSLLPSIQPSSSLSAITQPTTTTKHTNNTNHHQKNATPPLLLETLPHLLLRLRRDDPHQPSLRPQPRRLQHLADVQAHRQGVLRPPRDRRSAPRL